MAFTNIEIKARVAELHHIRHYLLQQGADCKGTDHQTDTYFKVPQGRLKLREGRLENALIWYRRPDDAGPRQSDFNLVEVTEVSALKELMTSALGILTIVQKQREIYFIGNVKFHLDVLLSLGSFVEIEASNKYGDLPVATLQEQCRYYMQAFRIAHDDLINVSYSDMLAV